MKQIVLLHILIVGQFLECHSFEFRNLFRNFAKDVSTYSSSSSVQTSSSSNNLLENNVKLPQNEPRFFADDENQDYNESISLTNGDLNIGIAEQQNLTNESLRNVNLTEAASNVSESLKDVPNSKAIPITSTEKSSSATDTSTITTTTGSHTYNRTDSSNATSSTEEMEEVVLGHQPSTFTYVTKTIYQKTVDFMGDPYMLSIFLPIAAGVLFALTIILTIVFCRCIKKKCRRRRFRKKALPDSIKNLRPSDQARLLGDCYDSSDEF